MFKQKLDDDGDDDDSECLKYLYSKCLCPNQIAQLLL